MKLALRSCLSAVPWLGLGLGVAMLPCGAARAASPDVDPGQSRATAATVAQDESTVLIPGPLQSLQRMAGISQNISAADVLPLLAHNIFMQGYVEERPTEFLLLIERYMQQARRLQALAGPGGKIKVSGCADAGALLQALGYRMRQGCGQKSFALETAAPERAFLTINSGFPLVELEEALQNGTPFVYPYPTSRVPALFHESDWQKLVTGPRRGYGSLVDVLLSERPVARLYWALSREDSETRISLERSPGLRALLPYAAVLDFYGTEISVRGGRVIVPGGAKAQSGWKDLVGASPDTPGAFVPSLLARDKGWLAAYFDTMSRVSQAQQAHLTESPRMRRLYEAFRSVSMDSSATRGVMRETPDLLVLFTRIQWQPDGQPYVPGDLAVWKGILQQRTNPKVIRDWTKRARNWDNPEQFLEGMTSLSRLTTDVGPLQIYLMSAEIDRKRQPENRISAAALRTLADNFYQFNLWYQMFAEFPNLDDASITQFVNVANNIGTIRNLTLRANTEGSFQATVGLWQILARQGQIPAKEMNASWLKVIEPFAGVTAAPQLFDAAHNALAALLASAGGNMDSPQAGIVDLLAGPRQESSDGQSAHQELSAKITSVLDDQRLVSLDTLFTLSEGLKGMTQPEAKGDNLLPLATELREFDLPQPIFTNSEKVRWAPPIYTNHHAELQVRTDLAKVIRGPSTRAQLEVARGQLAPFLRDTLVGLNYAYYEPPGAQMLHHNPLFVRSHDFLGISVLGADRLWGAPTLVGAGVAAGGGAYLMGSLADLSYTLATSEEDFIAPRNVQALIWKELVPVLMMSATIPRWWNITPAELHAATLYQRSGEEILMASATNAQMKASVIDILSDRMAPQRLEEVERALLRPEDAASMVRQVMPAESSYLAVEYRRRYPGERPSWGVASQQLDDLRSRNAADASWERISRDFGVPHPTLARTSASELLNVKPFPFFGSYSSRLFGESWESSNLYWARLADEMGYSPAALNSLVPELTQRTIANIFATGLDDWPAVFRAMQQTGQEFRQSRSTASPGGTTTVSVADPAVRDPKAQ